MSIQAKLMVVSLNLEDNCKYMQTRYFFLFGQNNCSHHRLAVF